MRKQIFQAICKRLNDRVPEIRWIDYWNNHLARLDGDPAWPVPAVFVEFEVIEWRQLSHAVRRGDVAVRLHVVTHAVGSGSTGAVSSDMVALFDLTDRIHAAVQGLRGDNFSAFQQTSSTTPHDHAEWMEGVERYVTNVQEVVLEAESDQVQI